MSTLEYRNMFYEAQLHKGKYFMVVADIKGSKQLKSDDFISMITSYKNLKTQNKLHWNGDAFAFYDLVENKTPEQIINQMKEWINSLPIHNLKVHLAGGYFDTLNWYEGNKLYYAGYCFDELANAHKENGVGTKYSSIYCAQ